MKRIFLFLITNLAILLVLSLALNSMYSLLGIQQNSLSGLLLLAAIFGFGGSFISLWISKWMAIRSTQAKVITTPQTEQESWLINTVRRQAELANIGMPEVAIYESNEMNAFATGANRNNALVAVSSGLLKQMTADEAEAVLAHEISHVSNGDMVTLTLIQGVLNTFVIFFARLIAMAIDGLLRSSNSSDEDNAEGLGFFAYMAVVFVLEMLFGFLASFIVMWFSRQREYRADAGAAHLAGKQKMINALIRLQNNSDTELDGTLTALAISGKQHGILDFLKSHPSLDSRIEALEQDRYTSHAR